MRTVRVLFSNGTTLSTSINGTKEEVRNYYIGKTFTEEDSNGNETKKTAIEVYFNDKETQKQIANTILQQLGGNKFIAMTGAKNFSAMDSGLSFKIGGSAKNRINHIRITLNDDDLYDVEYLYIYKKNFDYHTTVVQESIGLYADMLQTDFTVYTGFDTYMGKVLFR